MRAPAFTLRDIGLIAIICLTWGGNFLTSAAALRELPPLMFSALRMTLLGVVLLPFTHWPPRAQWPLLAAVVLCNVVLHFGLSFWSLKLAGDLASPAIIMQSYVPMAVLFAWLIRGERFAWRSGLAILVSFAGILVLGFDPIVLDNPQSMVLMLVSALFLAIGTVLMRGLSGIDAFSMQAWSAWIGLGPLLGWSALVEPGAWHAVQDASWIAWGGVAWAALIASLLGHSLFFVLVQKHPVAQIAPYLLMAPIVAVLLGVFVWGDRPGPRLWIGGAMVLGGVLAVALRALAKQRAVTPAPSEI
ncbi:MAG TPA: DMT family transporter [Pseudomonadota bacterium]|nr:DMT family transporter [Rhodanobacteraceae bacterium]MBP9154848.1 DMT family transporter [Xanthomonadales bacterium]HQW81292.1 DMT family transporter [Pseudomonadota bacterium]